MNFEKYEVVDIHEMLELEAKSFLKNAILETIEMKVYKLVVIHGYHGGQVLLKMVRNKLKSKYIREKQFSSNPGVTILWLRNNKI